MNDTYLAASDIGWVVGLSFTIYGPLLRGAIIVLYEGNPAIPNPGVLWAIILTFKVNGMYAILKGLRAIRKEDNLDEWVDKYDISTEGSVDGW